MESGVELIIRKVNARALTPLDDYSEKVLCGETRDGEQTL